MLNIYQSNQMERLVDALSDILGTPLSSPKMPEWVGVQTQGLGTWLGMEMSRRLGIWSNVYKPYPRALIEKLFHIVLGEDCPDTTRFEPALLSWSIMSLLPGLLSLPEFGGLSGYLADDPDGVKRFQLSRRIAETFDRYAVYRPEMVLRWESGAGGETILPENRWQPILWRAVVEVLGSTHVAGVAAAFLKTLREDISGFPDLPRRISMFGISSLPPLYLHILAGLPESVAVHLFLLNPSREYWAFIRSRKELIRTLHNQGMESDIADAALYFEEGHPLLASLGRIGREFQFVLEDACDYNEPGPGHYFDPQNDGPHSLLHHLQSDILNLRLRRPGFLPTLPIDPDDESIRIHNCHSPTREVQVLLDRLTDLFQTEPGIAPHDVIVMVPDISVYAPLIEAVFGVGETKIPYTVSDRGMSGESPVIKAFLGVLRLADSRFPVEEVLDFLALEPVADRFSLPREAVFLARKWLPDAGIRWGISGEHRAGFGQPALHGNTWAFGLERLLLGIAMPEKTQGLVYGSLPYGGIEGKETEALGRIIYFCETLFKVADRLVQNRTLSDWRIVLHEVLISLVAENADNGWQHRVVREALSSLGRCEAALGERATVSLKIIRQWLGDWFEQQPSARGFLSGGVTFCNLLPMRSIPFKVVCLMGMGDCEYPRNRTLPGFDLTGIKPRPGDRSVRNDDRYLFLEALLSARRRFMVFYGGQAIRDNSLIPPSVVVGELLDVIDEGFHLVSEDTAGEQKSLRSHIVIRHPLQPFNPAYFIPKSDRLFGYSSEFLAGAKALTGSRQDRGPFLTGPLPGPEIETVYMADLIRFFSMPVDYLLRQRLGIVLMEQWEAIESREPIALTGLDRFHAGESLLSETLRGRSPTEMLPLMHASGRFPPGSIGELSAENLLKKAVPVSEAVNKAVSGDLPLIPLQVQLDIDGVFIMGEIADLWPSGRLVHSFGELNERRKLSLWIQHLVLNAVNADGYPLRSLLIGRGKDGADRYGLEPIVASAKEILGDLLSLYRLGLTLPLPFFPMASYAYAARMKSGEKTDPGSAMMAALRKWHGGFQGPPGEGQHLAVQRVFGEMNPLITASFGPDLKFTALALRVFGPMIDAETGSDSACAACLTGLRIEGKGA